MNERMRVNTYINSENKFKYKLSILRLLNEKYVVNVKQSMS